MENAFKIENLSFSFDSSSEFIIKNINLEIKKNSISIIAGRNGSGKSTLIKLLANILTNKHGQILMENKNLNTYSHKELALKLSYVQQSYSIDIPLTVEETINLGFYPHKNPANAIKIKKNLIDAFGIKHLLNKNFNNISGGEKQMTLITRSLCQSTNIILLDEPTASLDFKHKTSIMDILRKLVHEINATVIMVSHDLNLITRYADNLIFIDKKTATVGTKKDMLTKGKLSQLYDTKIYSVSDNIEQIYYY